MLKQVLYTVTTLLQRAKGSGAWWLAVSIQLSLAPIHFCIVQLLHYVTMLSALLIEERASAICSIAGVLNEAR
jgi:hypothetical protein